MRGSNLLVPPVCAVLTLKLRFRLKFKSIPNEVVRKGSSLKLSTAILILFLTGSLNALASTDDEISHLLSFVASTGCQYERNGTMHNGAEAVNHINRKYEYFLDKIESTEDFVKYSATKSKMSGKYYKIHCDGKLAVRSKDWLLEELMRYRR
jgi:hypothetical protein